MKRVLLIGALAVLIVGCAQQQQTTEQVNVNEKSIVRTQPATLEEVEEIAQFTSDDRCFQQNNIVPAMGNRISSILVKVGDRVSRGQLLVVMDNTQYSQMEAQIANLEQDYQRMRAVYEAGGISKQQYDQISTQLNVQRTALNNLRDNVELRSPIDGVVSMRNFEPGDMYGMTMPILQVVQINTLKVVANISEQYFTQVKIGTSVDVMVDIYPDKSFSGRVSLIHPTIDPASRTFGIEVTIPNGNGELRPGMFSRSTIIFGKSEGVMVEDVAVQKQAGSNERYLFVAERGRAVRRTVTVGRQIGNRINILSGVEAGEEVIVAGLSHLVDGSEIEIRN